MCVATGIPNPHISWLKDGEPSIEQEMHLQTMDVVFNERNVTFVKSVLEIQNAHSNDTGIYTCVASVPRLEATDSFNLTVITLSASIISPPINQTIIIASGVALTCTAIGIPPPSFTWRVFPPEVGEVMFSTSRTLISTQVSVEEGIPVVNSTLNVTSVAADTGYSCEAINDYGTDTATAYITVQGMYNPYL